MASLPSPHAMSRLPTWAVLPCPPRLFRSTWEQDLDDSPSSSIDLDIDIPTRCQRQRQIQRRETPSCSSDLSYLSLSLGLSLASASKGHGNIHPLTSERDISSDPTAALALCLPAVFCLHTALRLRRSTPDTPASPCFCKWSTSEQIVDPAFDHHYRHRKLHTFSPRTWRHREGNPGLTAFNLAPWPLPWAGASQTMSPAPPPRLS